VSGVDGSGPVPTKGRIHPLYLIFVAIVVVVLSFGLAGLRFLGGILLVASTGFLLTLVIWPSGLTLASRLLRGFGLGLLATFYTGFWLAKFHLLDWFVPILVVELLLFSIPPVRRGREAIRQHVYGFRAFKGPPMRKLLRERWNLIIVILLATFSLTMLVLGGVQDPRPVGQQDVALFLGVAKQIDRHNGFIENYPFLDPPFGRPLSLPVQGFALLATVSSKVTGTGILITYQCLALVNFLLLVASIFLIGAELGGKGGATLAVFFLCTMPFAMSGFYFKGFDRNAWNITMSCWTAYFLIKIFSARSAREGALWGIWASAVYGAFMMTWDGALYLVPAMVGGVALIPLTPVIRFLFPATPAASPTKGSSSTRSLSERRLLFRFLPALMGVLVALGGSTLLALPFQASNWSTLVSTASSYAKGQTQQMVLGAHAPSLWEGVGSVYSQSPGSKVPLGDLGNCITFLVFLLLCFGVVYIFLFREYLLPFVLAWLILLVAIVWPGKGFWRFYNLWIPPLSLLLSAGVLLIRRKTRFFPLVMLILISLLIYNTVAYYGNVIHPPPLDVSKSEVYASIAEWVAKNTPENAVIGGPFGIGHLIAGYSERVSLCDPTGWASSWVDVRYENSSPLFPPHLVGRDVGGRLVSLDRFLPWRGYRPSGREIDMLAWPYLDEGELENLLEYYRRCGIRIDYLYYYGQYEYGREIGYIREEDILEWTTNLETSADGVLARFGRDNILIDQRLLARGQAGDYYVTVPAVQVSENEFWWNRPNIYPAQIQTRGTVLLVMKGEEAVMAALCRPHPKPTVGVMLSMLDAPPAPSPAPPLGCLEVVFRNPRGGLVARVRWENFWSWGQQI
jgi:hypothetical protein